jgi:hypothetical protein
LKGRGLTGVADGCRPLADAHPVVALDPRVDLSILGTSGRLPKEGSDWLAVGGGVGEIEREGAPLKPALAERLQQKGREELHVDRAGDRSPTETELRGGGVVVDAALRVGCAVDGAAKWADEDLAVDPDLRLDDSGQCSTIRLDLA